MPDLPVEPPGPSRYPVDMETRVAVLEQIARTTTESLGQLVRNMEALRAEQRADFRWLLGITLAGFSALLGVMAHGFHWL